MILSNKFSGYYPSGWFFMADDWIGVDEPGTIDKRVDTETVIFGTTTVMRERMQIAGVSSGAIAPVSSVTGLSVAISGNSTATLAANSTLTASLTAGSTVGVVLTTASKVQIETSAAGTIPISGNSTVSLAAGSTLAASLTAGTTLTASLTAGSTVGVVLTSASITTASTVGVSFTTASTVNVRLSNGTTTIDTFYDVDSSATAVENVQGVSIRLATTGGSREGGSTANPLAVTLQASTATVTIQGNSTVSLAAGSTLTASLTAGSTIGVILTSASITTASTVGVSFSTASTVSVVFTTATTGRVELAAGTTLTASLTAGSTLTASLTAGSTVGVVLTTASVVRVESGSTVLAVTGTSNVSGSTVISYPQITLAQGTTVLTPSFASISFATSGAQAIVSSVANAVVRVLQWDLVAASTDSLQWRSGTSAISGLMAFAANGGISVPYSPVGLFQGTSGSALNLFSETATSVGGSIVYLQSTSL